MCRINFNLEITTPNNETNYSVKAKYRKVGTSEWNSKDILDITRAGINVTTGEGEYELKVSITTLDSGLTNDSEIVLFSVENCPVLVPIETHKCYTGTFTKVGDVNPIVTYIDCEGVEVRYDINNPTLTFETGETTLEGSNTFTIGCMRSVINTINVQDFYLTETDAVCNNQR